MSCDENRAAIRRPLVPSGDTCTLQEAGERSSLRYCKSCVSIDWLGFYCSLRNNSSPCADSSSQNSRIFTRHHFKHLLHIFQKEDFYSFQSTSLSVKGIVNEVSPSHLAVKASTSRPFLFNCNAHWLSLVMARHAKSRSPSPIGSAHSSSKRTRRDDDRYDRARDRRDDGRGHRHRSRSRSPDVSQDRIS